jgi:hypothetical protein
LKADKTENKRGVKMKKAIIKLVVKNWFSILALLLVLLSIDIMSHSFETKNTLGLCIGLISFCSINFIYVIKKL